jgi:hypothetical protein
MKIRAIFIVSAFIDMLILSPRPAFCTYDRKNCDLSMVVKAVPSRTIIPGTRTLRPTSLEEFLQVIEDEIDEPHPTLFIERANPAQLDAIADRLHQDGPGKMLRLEGSDLRVDRLQFPDVPLLREVNEGTLVIAGIEQAPIPAQNLFAHALTRIQKHRNSSDKEFPEFRLIILSHELATELSKKNLLSASLEGVMRLGSWIQFPPRGLKWAINSGPTLTHAEASNTYFRIPTELRVQLEKYLPPSHKRGEATKVFNEILEASLNYLDHVDFNSLQFSEREAEKTFPESNTPLQSVRVSRKLIDRIRRFHRDIFKPGWPLKRRLNQTETLNYLLAKGLELRESKK